MSWTRKILRVDLNSGSCTTEDLNMQWARDYLGQRGLASKYLTEEVDPKCDALGPENKLIMDRAFDGHHGLDFGSLLGDHQRSADGCNRLLQLGWIFWC